MLRIKFKEGEQGKFLLHIQENTGLSWSNLAKLVSVHTRTLLDWRKEKYTISQDAFNKFKPLVEKTYSIPKHEFLSDLWHLPRAAQMGGLALAKHGGPGTPYGRQKGGTNSQKNRRLFPDLYKNCNLRKNIHRPSNSIQLAEFIGIFLGDGGINNDSQIVIHLHKEHDAEYSFFVEKMIEKLFHIKPVIYTYKALRRENVRGITVSSVAVVEFLRDKSIPKGNKVRIQIDVPTWIKDNLRFSKSCLRGLIDTDGGVYYHRHGYKDHLNFNIGLAFSNKSIPLLRFVRDTLSRLGFTPKINYNNCNVYLYRENEVIRYSKEIKFSNPYHSKRLKNYLEQKARKGV